MVQAGGHVWVVGGAVLSTIQGGQFLMEGEQSGFGGHVWVEIAHWMAMGDMGGASTCSIKD